MIGILSSTSSRRSIMLRRKLSAGLLRASAQASATPTTGIAKPLGTQSANLASAVLLSSGKNWREETVNTLKGELKKRGLSQQGNKAQLVARLASSDVTTLLPPQPPLARELRKTASTPALRPRTISSTAPKRFPPKTSDSSASTPPATPAAPTTEADHHDHSVSTTGPAVSSQRTEAPKVEKVAPEAVTVAPGLPETKDAGKNVGNMLNIKMPKPREEGEIDQIIPMTPDNFRSNAALSSSSKSAPKEEESLPKVVTVASASTHIGGGPTSAVHEAGDAHTIEVTAEEAAAKASELVDEAAKNIPGLASAFSNFLSAPVKAWSNAGLSTSLLPEIGSPKGLHKAEGEYKANDKPLDGEQKRGAYVLGGIVLFGFLIGGPKSSKKEKHHKLETDLARAAGAAGGVQGDAQWAKASGAGVVGHGHRKD